MKRLNQSFTSLLFSALFLSALILIGCQSTNENLNNENLISENTSEKTKTFKAPDSAFTLQYPKDWILSTTELENGDIYTFDTLKLVVFEKENFEAFRESFLSEESETIEQETGFGPVEIVHYKTHTENGVYDMAEQAGTIALWTQNKMGYGLLDVNDIHQRSAKFLPFLLSIDFK